jgi:23S rRNA (guanine1835-N2)-methyltransferase
VNAPSAPEPAVAMADPVMSVPQGTFALQRHPDRSREELRAWDAADELLLSRLAGVDPGVADGWSPIEHRGATVVLHDAFGALAVALAERSPTVVVDSYCSTVAIERNCALNGVDPSTIQVGSPLDELDGPVSLLVVRPPRNLALLEHLLRSVRPQLAPDAVVVGAEMVKHLHASTLAVFERVLGPTTTSRAHRRARAIECRPDPTLDPGPWDWPTTFTLEPGAHRVTSWPGVFAASRLDHGTALLLEHLPETDGPETIIDLGCGNGVLGTFAAIENPEAQVTFVDDSALALVSAQATFADNVDDGRTPRMVHGNGLFDPEVAEPGSVGLVLTNPPFHEHRAMGDAVAWQMFTDAHRALRVDGELWVVGNRHLAHHAKLQRIFGNCEVVGSSPKFVALRAVRR